MLRSESKLPGMHSNRHCLKCAELLAIDDGELCSECRPHLSEAARAASELRRAELEAIAKLESAIDNLDMLVRKVNRKLGDR